MHVYVWVYELINVLNLKLGSSKFSVFTSSDLQIFSKAISKSLGIGYVHAIYTQTHIWIYTYVLYTWMHAHMYYIHGYAHSQLTDTAGRTYMSVHGCSN